MVEGNVKKLELWKGYDYHYKRLTIPSNLPYRFLLYDPNTKLWYDVGDGYAREKVSHSLRSRPNEQRRTKPKPRKRTIRKPPHSPYLEAIVQRLIADQQALLKTMIRKETSNELSIAAGLTLASENLQTDR